MDVEALLSPTEACAKERAPWGRGGVSGGQGDGGTACLPVPVLGSGSKRSLIVKEEEQSPLLLYFVYFPEGRTIWNGVLFT